MKPILFIFSGLPASGKSTLAKLIVEKRGGAYIRIDTIEQGLRDLCDYKVEGEGYRLAYRIVADNLIRGKDVIADCCNPITLTRFEWENVAIENNASFINIEVVCANKLEHKRRVLTRENEIPGLSLPTWEEIQKREYHIWEKDRILIDTSEKTIMKSFEELMSKIEENVTDLKAGTAFKKK